MKVVFIHQNMPGQYKHLAAALAADPANQVVFITRRAAYAMPGVRRIVYRPHREAEKSIHPYLRSTEDAVLHGQEVARILLGLRKEGFVPDVIVGHPGWGETLFVKDACPHTPYLNYCEFYYGAEGRDFNFDPAQPPTLDARLALRVRSTALLHGALICDRGVAPTFWQRDTHPAAFQDKIAVIHDGVDTAALQPDPGAVFRFADGRALTRHDKVVTYVARNLEPYRGFPTFMRALPQILDAAPDAEVLIIGGDETSYGGKPRDAANWREAMLAETGLQSDRVHFMGRLPYEQYRAALLVSTVHVYLTYPFVLSWSMLEAMAMGCLVLGSDTAPVREVIEDGVNGLLTDFFSHQTLADKVAQILRAPDEFSPLRRAARRTVETRYALADCLPRQVALIAELADVRYGG